MRIRVRVPHWLASVWDAFCDWGNVPIWSRGRFEVRAELVEAAVEETLAYYAFPEEHWRRIRTNNPLERILREIRRRTRVVGAFPDGQSALNLAAVCCRGRITRFDRRRTARPHATSAVAAFNWNPARHQLESVAALRWNAHLE
jgi:hypothetical protein